MSAHLVCCSATDELLRTYPALTQMDEAHPWFRPFVHEVVVEKMRISKLTIVRLALALSLSFFDIITDLLTVSAYWGGNLQTTAHTILALVCLSLLFQSFATFMRYRHLGAKQVAREVSLVLCFVKPVVDLYRQIIGEEVDGAPFNTASERVIHKIAETVCESVPGCIIQVITFLLVVNRPALPFASIVISWITTAFKTSSLAFSLDKDLVSRQRNSKFYGTHDHLPAPHCNATAIANLLV